MAVRREVVFHNGPAVFLPGLDRRDRSAVCVEQPELPGAANHHAERTDLPRPLGVDEKENAFFPVPAHLIEQFFRRIPILPDHLDVAALLDSVE